MSLLFIVGSLSDRLRGWPRERGRRDQGRGSLGLTTCTEGSTWCTTGSLTSALLSSSSTRIRQTRGLWKKPASIAAPLPGQGNEQPAAEGRRGQDGRNQGE